MAANDQEMEVKFYLGRLSGDLPGLENHLQELKAGITAPRILEINLRFDTKDGRMTQAHQVLRLRKDANARITYKGPGNIDEGVTSRVELEITVSDFNTAKKLLEALGFQVAVIYEKYRTTYLLDQVQVTLDEMPFGYFAEIEGPDAESIQKAAHQLGLDWEKRIFESYLALFDKLRNAKGFDFRDLTFENFRDMEVDMEIIGLQKT